MAGLKESAELIRERKSKDKSKKNREKDARVLYALCHSKEILAGRIRLVKIDAIESFIKKSGEEQEKAESELKDLLKARWLEQEKEHKEILDKLDKLKGTGDLKELNNNIKEARDTIAQLKLFKDAVDKKNEREYENIVSYLKRAEKIEGDIEYSLKNISKDLKELREGQGNISRKQEEILKRLDKDPIEKIRKTREKYWNDIKNTEYYKEMVFRLKIFLNFPRHQLW